MYNITFTSGGFNILAGGQDSFELITYRASTNDTVSTGTRYGQGFLEGEGWQPAPPGDDFIGPAPIYTLTPTIFSISLSTGTVYLGITNLTIGASNTIERSFDLVSNVWDSADGFISGSSWTNWSEDVNSEWWRVFYRVRSEK